MEEKKRIFLCNIFFACSIVLALLAEPFLADQAPFSLCRVPLEAPALSRVIA